MLERERYELSLLREELRETTTAAKDLATALVDLDLLVGPVRITPAVPGQEGTRRPDAKVVSIATRRAG